MTYDWRKDPDLIWPEDEKEQENKMIRFKKQVPEWVNCRIMVAVEGQNVIRMQEATEEDLKAAGYVPAKLGTGSQYVQQENRIADLEKELSDWKDSCVNRSLVAQAKRIDEQAREIVSLKEEVQSLLEAKRNSVERSLHNATINECMRLRNQLEQTQRELSNARIARDADNA